MRDDASERITHGTIHWRICTGKAYLCHRQDGADVRALTGQLLLEHPDCIIISDEIGNGIVPMEHEEREYRELTGRLLCELANKADRVERIVCGIGERIK